MTYTLDSFDQAMQANLRLERGLYGVIDDWLRTAIKRHAPSGPGLLIGSREQGFGPWYEALLLSLGIGPVFVTDYNAVSYERAEGVCFLPSPVEPSSLFQTIVSISSIEHSGLGLYGEAVDPDGDLNAMQQARQLLADQGLMFLAVPLGVDEIRENTHRVYGRLRLPRLLEGWKLIDSVGFEDSMLDRPAEFTWNQPERGVLPEPAPILVLRKGGA